MFLRSPRENAKYLPSTPLETYLPTLVEVHSAVLTLCLLLQLRRVCQSCPFTSSSGLPPSQQLPKVPLLTDAVWGLAHSVCPKGRLRRGCLRYATCPPPLPLPGREPQAGGCAAAAGREPRLAMGEPQGDLEAPHRSLGGRCRRRGWPQLPSLVPAWCRALGRD